MSRKMIALAVLLSVAVEAAQAERFISFNMTFSGGVVTEGTVIIGTQEIGQPAITPVFTGGIEATDDDPGMTASVLMRDRMIPVEGIAGVAKRAECPTCINLPAIRVFHPDNVQFWASVDNGNSWTLIVPNVNPNQIRLDIGTTSVFFGDHGSNELLLSGGSGAVPAVSSWGVAIMALLIVAAGGVAFRRRVA